MSPAWRVCTFGPSEVRVHGLDATGADACVDTDAAGEDFTYNGPVERTGEGVIGRNGAMARWGRAQLERGHDVYTVALVAPWSLSGGTKNATREFREGMPGGGKRPRNANPARRKTAGIPAVSRKVFSTTLFC